METASNDTGREEIRTLQAVYRSGLVSLAAEFFVPCLNHCSRYLRAAGYFSSSALASWAGALLRLAHDEVQIKLLIAPILSDQDLAAIAAAVDDVTRTELLHRASDRLIEDILAYIDDNSDTARRLRLFAWMLAAGKLELRFALARHIEDAGMFHEKSGVFEFPWGDRVAFSGSPNETEYGHVRNYEKIHVFRSWVDADQERITATTDDFLRQWEGRDDALLVVGLSKSALDLARSRSKNRTDTQDTSAPPVESRWRHQIEGRDTFLRCKRGILEMATGTGKTRTALLILESLLSDRRIDKAIITTDGTDLLDQWYRTLLEWPPLLKNGLRIFRQYADHHQAEIFLGDSSFAFCLVSREQLGPVLRGIQRDHPEHALILHDEVHGLGAPKCMLEYRGMHGMFGYALGLSATPEREYDEQGSEFIREEIGPVIYRFGLEDAIRRGILCEFDYVPLAYRLTEGDKKRLSAVYSKQAARKNEGRPMTKEELWTELARVYKTAELKPAVFADYVHNHPSILKRSIIFVEERWYGDLILPILERYTHLYRTYYAEDDRLHLIEFARGRLECLLTCHRISQGIDIRGLQTVILFSAARAKLETIQRIGRCLRTDPTEPTKRALVIDFVRDDDDHAAPGYESADALRAQWLTELAQVQREEK